jgi:hypothetical protein
MGKYLEGGQGSQRAVEPRSSNSSSSSSSSSSTSVKIYSQRCSFVRKLQAGPLLL